MRQHRRAFYNLPLMQIYLVYAPAMASSNTTSACAVPHARRSSPIELADSYHGGLEISAVLDFAGEHIEGRPRYSTRSNQVYTRLALGQCD